MQEKRIIINVGRQLGSGGREIAALLAEIFGCRVYDRELLNLAAKESGFCERFFEQNDERKGFLRWLGLHIATTANASYHDNNFSQDNLFRFQSEAIRHAAMSGSCVFVGRCADYVLRDFDNVTNIFITCDIDERAARVAARHGCDIAAAKKIISEKEGARAQYYNFYTGKRWGDCSSYDLCVCSSVLGVKATADYIARFVAQRMNIELDDKSK